MQFFTVEYWFGFPRLITTGMGAVLLTLFLVLLVGGIAVQVWHEKITDRWLRQVLKRAGSGAEWIGALGLCLLVARYERVPVFMYRYWFLFLGIAAALWLFRISRYAEARREKLEEETQKYETRDKYFQR